MAKRQAKDDEPPISPPGSSFPILSPSFWDDAATIDKALKPAKRSNVADDSVKTELKNEKGTGKKKARFASPSPSPDISSSPLREYLKAEGDHDPGIMMQDQVKGNKKKKARFASPSPSPDISSSPLRELIKAEDDAVQLAKSKEDGNARLSFLPNRLDPALFDAPNAYLASAEYAPNKFGDIGDYMRKKEIKVQTQNRDIALSSADPNVPQIFTGQSFWINGNTTPPMEELRKMILQRGGEVRPKLWNKGYVKFIIAPSLTLRKFDEFKNYKVVKEGWIVESCKEGRMLDWTRWKLQIVGGWEESGRKGLEGFLRGEPSQRPKREIAEVEEEEEEIEEHVENHNVVGTAHGPSLGTSSLLNPTATPAATRSLIGQASEDRVPTAPNPTATPVATRSLINRSPKIPISPNHQKATSPNRELVPPKVQKPEGAWENYYTKDSNEHAAEALKNSDWRVKNTAERGNEGGFIDGYYQNSRYVASFSNSIM
jgi:DNA repair protein REV1